MKRFRRRLHANWLYLKRPLKGFLPLLLFATALVVVGGTLFYLLYTKRPITFGESLYLTYCLIFMEHLYEYPEMPVLRLFYWVLPPLGLVVILDGVVRFSYHVLRRDDSSREWVRAMSHTMNNHVILIGLGKLGIRVLQQLVALGEDVAVLEKDPQCPNIAFARKNDVPVRIGSSRQEDILEDLHVGKAKSIILATNDDLANLELALDARRANPEIRVVLRMFDQELASKVKESFDIPLSFSTSALAAPLFATSSSDKSIVNSFYVGDRLQVVSQLTVGETSQLAGRSVSDLHEKDQIVVVNLDRAGEVQFYPPVGTVLQVGDRVTLQTEPDRLRAVHEWNGDKKPY